MPSIEIIIGATVATVIVLAFLVIVFSEIAKRKRKREMNGTNSFQEEKKVKRKVEQVRPEDVHAEEKSEPQKVAKVPEVKEEAPKPEPKKEEPPKASVPTHHYERFNAQRAMDEFGLGEDEIKDFIQDLIAQIDTEMPVLSDAIQRNDRVLSERSTHKIKGSAVNLGAGGIADLLSDFNTYLKGSFKKPEVDAYFVDLEFYLKQLKEDFA